MAERNVRLHWCTAARLAVGAEASRGYGNVLKFCHWRQIERVIVTLSDRDHPDQRLALILERRGLFAWKLAAVDIQNDARA